MRHAGAKGQLTVRADSGSYTHAVVAVCRKTKVRFSITIRQRASLRNLIEAIPEAGWTPIPYWMDGAADVAETAYTPFRSKRDAAPVRLIVQRVKPTPGSQLALFASYSYHGFITDRDGDTLELEGLVSPAAGCLHPRCHETSGRPSGLYGKLARRAAFLPFLPGVFRSGGGRGRPRAWWFFAGPQKTDLCKKSARGYPATGCGVHALGSVQ